MWSSDKSIAVYLESFRGTTFDSLIPLPFVLHLGVLALVVPIVAMKVYAEVGESRDCVRPGWPREDSGLDVCSASVCRLRTTTIYLDPLHEEGGVLSG